MKYTRIATVVLGFVAIILIPCVALGQGTIYFSNLSRPSVGSLLVGSDSWYAGQFSTGTNSGGYSLNSVHLKIDNATGVPNGFTVAIHTNSSPFSVYPGGSIGLLVGSSDPTSGGIYIYTPVSPILLNGVYFIVVTAETEVATGAYAWSNVNSFTYNPSNGWGADFAFHSNDGSTWIADSGSFPQFAVDASRVPEPSASLLFFMAGLLAVCSRFRL